MAEENPTEENTPEEQAQAGAQSDPETQDEVRVPEANADDDAVAEEVAKLKDQLLRSYADVENIKRRAQRDVEHAHKFAVEKLLNDLVPVLDSMEKAVETAQGTEGAQAIAEGVALSLKLFLDTLEKSGVTQIDPLGEPFDPQLHEAMTMVPNPDAEPNTVMDVMAKGYLLNGRLVRAAKVIVVQGNS
jgi:molecular chaperone GrpE